MSNPPRKLMGSIALTPSDELLRQYILFPHGARFDATPSIFFDYLRTDEERLREQEGAPALVCYVDDVSGDGFTLCVHRQFIASDAPATRQFNWLAVSPI